MDFSTKELFSDHVLLTLRLPELHSTPETTDERSDWINERAFCLFLYNGQTHHYMLVAELISLYSLAGAHYHRKTETKCSSMKRWWQSVDRGEYMDEWIVFSVRTIDFTRLSAIFERDSSVSSTYSVVLPFLLFPISLCFISFPFLGCFNNNSFVVLLLSSKSL